MEGFIGLTVLNQNIFFVEKFQPDCLQESIPASYITKGKPLEEDLSSGTQRLYIELRDPELVPTHSLQHTQSPLVIMEYLRC